jgi:hypothetical protein
VTFATVVEQAQAFLRSTGPLEDDELQIRLCRAASRVAGDVSEEFLASAWAQEVARKRSRKETVSHREQTRHYRIALALTIVDKVRQHEGAGEAEHGREATEAPQWAILLPREHRSTASAGAVRKP